ncbi:MAG: hypothetical protein EA421_02550 [Gemmatimonadales bacterium]|nr:MAG: hypothetical protein EA421_02550 [Gemmatimonadales bacterium]
MERNGWLLLAVVLLVVGVGSLFIDGISYVTEETVVDVGPLEVSAEREERLGIPLWASVLILLAGAGAFFVGARGKGSG